MSFRLLPLSLAVASLFPVLSYAEEITTTEAKELSSISVNAKTHRRATNERINRTTLENEMIQNNRDLVRYSTDVGIADQGRHSKGFAIRGVEDNRVGISIDGVALPDSEENSLYKRYGNLNTSRQSIDPELARTVEISKGADSFNQGSGNLGGGVNYRTLEPSDIVRNGNKFGAMYRTGYTSRNNEWINTLGTAYTGEKAEIVLLYSHRRGHEMESAGGFTLPEDTRYTRERGRSRQIPDEAKHKSNSYLAKWAYSFNPHHRTGLSWSSQRGNNYIIEDSGVSLYSNWRESDDRHERNTVNAFYEYTPDSKWLALIKADVDYQKTETAAINYEGTRFEPATPWSSAQPAKPSDTNIRIFSTDFQRLNLRMDTQPLKLGNTSHSFSLKTSVSKRHFDVLHKDSVYLSNAWIELDDSTMMRPVKTNHYTVSLHDNIRFNDIFSGHAGIRYDHTKMSQQDTDLKCFGNRVCPRNENAKFTGFSWTMGLDAQLNKAWKVGYNIGTGFRVPNASEMYFDYRDNAAGAWMSNPNLEAERSLSQAISLQGNGSYGKLSLALHHTKYKDFLYEQETWDNYQAYGRSFWRPVQQMQNIDSAKIYGLELTGTLNLNRITPLPEGWKFFGAVGLNKGSMSNGADLLSLQPLKAVIGLDYEHPEGKWGIFSRLTYMAAKKPKDAQYMKTLDERCTKQEIRPNPYWPYWGSGPNEITCTQYAHETGLETWPHLNKKAAIFDLYGYYKPTQNLTLRAGIYNMFDRKYHTWDTLRGLNITGGVVNSVGVRPNPNYGGYPGLERYYAPGRNFAVSLEYKF